MPDFIGYEFDDPKRWICKCGNRAGALYGGFCGYRPRDWPGVRKGSKRWKQPWDGVTYVCVTCGRLIDSRTRELVGTHQKDERERKRKEQTEEQVERPRGIIARLLGR